MILYVPIYVYSVLPACTCTIKCAHTENIFLACCYSNMYILVRISPKPGICILTYFKKLTIIINDVDSCSVPNILSSILNTSNQERIVRSESQNDCVIILQSDHIISSKQRNFCTIFKFNGFQLFKIGIFCNVYMKRRKKYLYIREVTIKSLTCSTSHWSDNSRNPQW